MQVIRAIIKMIEDWMKNKNTPITVTQAPSLREKSILLVKLMQYVEKRFADDLELNAQFLELVNFIYRDEQLKTTELTSKLEAAFLGMNMKYTYNIFINLIKYISVYLFALFRPKTYIFVNIFYQDYFYLCSCI